jgi:DNA-directed RNA polymerase subunit RPC12/RpoP
MGISGGLLECPHCSNHVQDTKQEYIDCRFCGKRFKRGAIAKEKEEELRRTMVLDLSDTVTKMNAVISAGKMFGGLFLVMFIILLFSKEFGTIEILLTVSFLTNGLVWFGLSAFNSSKLEKIQSKLFDLTGGRSVFEY